MKKQEVEICSLYLLRNNVRYPCLEGRMQHFLPRSPRVAVRVEEDAGHPLLFSQAFGEIASVASTFFSAMDFFLWVGYTCIIRSKMHTALATGAKSSHF